MVPADARRAARAERREERVPLQAAGDWAIVPVGNVRDVAAPEQNSGAALARGIEVKGIGDLSRPALQVYQSTAKTPTRVNLSTLGRMLGVDCRIETSSFTGGTT